MEIIAGIFFLVLGLVIAVLIAHSHGDKKGAQRGELQGRRIGEALERARWIEQAKAAAKAGTPWAGVTLPEEPVEEEE